MTVIVTTKNCVDVPDGVDDPDAVAEAVVKRALESEEVIYLVKVMRTSILLEQ